MRDQNAPVAAGADDAWPPLPLAAWRDTYATLHMWTQIVGKTALALAPWQNHWWQVALHVTARGLATAPLPSDRLTFDVSFDFVDHRLEVRTSEGTGRAIPLVAQSVADFYQAYQAALAGLGLRVRLWPVPVEVERAIPFAEDREHHAYDPLHAWRLFRALTLADRVLKRFRGGFLGKASPVHFFWGSFDLAYTRFSGPAAPAYPGGAPNTPAYVMREAYSHECASCGFWPGNDIYPEPAFYAYAYPAPPGYDAAAVRGPGFYSSALGEFILPYETVRSSAQPEAVVLEFLESTYAAAADLGRWDRRALEHAGRVR